MHLPQGNTDESVLASVYDLDSLKALLPGNAPGAVEWLVVGHPGA
jgi:hypothetical protein